MERETTDILISGCGLAGLVAAAAFENAGYSVMIVDPVKPTIAFQNDYRSTAYLRPAKRFLSDIGLWPLLEPNAVALKTLRIVDCTGEPLSVRDERSFQSEGHNSEPLGWNFLNSFTRKELLVHLNKQPGIDIRFGVGFAGILPRAQSAIVTLSDGAQISAKLTIGADGRNSAVREFVGIKAKTTRYGQKSLAFCATHLLPHNNISTEIYHQGGPFTMVPINDVNKKPASAIVWMNDGQLTNELANMPVKEFNVQITQRSASLFGPMELSSGRAVWPIVNQIANSLIADRTALIAEAAHVFPPIGAQGLNTSLQDISALLRAAKSYPGDLGGPGMLTAYQNFRKSDINNRARAIDLFNRVTRSGDIRLQTLRLLGLKVAHDLPPVRAALISAGMGRS